MTPFDTFLEYVIEDGIAAVKRDYARPDQKQKRDGSIAGFEACRGQDTKQLAELLSAAKTGREDARLNNRENYWWYRCYEAEVEWVCNVVSAAMVNQGLNPIITPTARGMIQAGKILGVEGAPDK